MESYKVTKQNKILGPFSTKNWVLVPSMSGAEMKTALRISSFWRIAGE